MTEVARVIAVAEMCGEFSHIAFADWLTNTTRRNSLHAGFSHSPIRISCAAPSCEDRVAIHPNMAPTQR